MRRGSSPDEYLEILPEGVRRKRVVEELALDSDEDKIGRQQGRDKKMNLAAALKKMEELAAELDTAVPRSPPSACELPETNQLPSFDAVSNALFAGTGGSAWGADASAWDARLRRLTTRDLLIIHKQFAQQAAPLLVPAELLGPGSHAFKELARIDHAYICFTERAMALAPPEIWAPRSTLDAETMSVIRPPTHDTLMAISLRCPRPSLANAARTFRRFEAESRRLKAEQQLLLQRLGALQLSSETAPPEMMSQEGGHQEGGHQADSQGDAHPGQGRAGSDKSNRAGQSSALSGLAPQLNVGEEERHFSDSSGAEAPPAAAAAASASTSSSTSPAAQMMLLLDVNAEEQRAALKTFVADGAHAVGTMTRAKLFLQLYPCE